MVKASETDRGSEANPSDLEDENEVGCDFKTRRKRFEIRTEKGSKVTVTTQSASRAKNKTNI